MAFPFKKGKPLEKKIPMVRLHSFYTHTHIHTLPVANPRLRDLNRTQTPPYGRSDDIIFHVDCLNASKRGSRGLPYGIMPYATLELNVTYKF